MEENERKNSNLFLAVSLIIIVVLVIGIVCLIIVNARANDQLKHQLEEKSTKIEKLENEITELKKPEIDTDSKEEKAKKLAKEVVDAVEEDNLDYLDNLLDNDAVETGFRKYGIYDYKVDLNDYSVLKGKDSLEEDPDGNIYTFNESFKSVYPVGESLGGLLVIEFYEDGTYSIKALCTGP